MFEDFGRRALPLGMARGPIAVVQVAVKLHEANGDQPVEPGVGHRLHDWSNPRRSIRASSRLRFAATERGKGLPAMMATSPFSTIGSVLSFASPYMRGRSVTARMKSRRAWGA